MYSVSRRAAWRIVWQPRLGLLPLRSFKKTVLGPGEDEILECNLDGKSGGGIMGMAVDYLTRFLTGTPAETAFKISLAGARKLEENPYFKKEKPVKTAKKLLRKVKRLDDETIVAACKLAGFDAAFRAGVDYYKPVSNIYPDKAAIHNIHTMVSRTLDFLQLYGPITVSGPTFPGGYSVVVSSGDGDFLTKDTIWDLKNTKNWILKKDTLQILMYYLMGKRSKVEEFQTVEKLGIFNPRKNIAYQIAAKDIDPKVIEYVEKVIIGYGITEEELYVDLKGYKVSEKDYNDFFDIAPRQS